jgi:hypothetical protein
MKNLTGKAILITGMSKSDRENTKTETKGCVLDIHYGGETHFDLRCLTVVEKSVTDKRQSKNNTTVTPCLYKYNRDHAFYSNCSSGVHTDVATVLMFILRERQDRRLTY